jgi:iron-sulfur cluster assembly protein
MNQANNQIMSLTSKAIGHVKSLLDSRGKDSAGIRIGVKSGGCSGFKYFVEYADEIRPYEEIIKTNNLTIIIDPKALMYLIGTEMDYISEDFKSWFIFTNPNEKAKCGCGSSFSV